MIGLGFGLALKRWNFLPEMIQHRIGRRVSIVRSTMHLAAGDDVDARDLLFQDGRLRGPVVARR